MSEKQNAITPISSEMIIRQCLKTPGVKINRADFLRTQLSHICKTEVVDRAIAANPAQAGITRAEVNCLANAAIKYENAKVTGISALSAIPGGLTMIATIPADITQYFVFVLRIMQKLAYLYGFEEFALQEDNIEDEVMYEIFPFMGVIFGVKGATNGVKYLVQAMTSQVTKNLSKKALMKTTIYPIVKKIAKQLGIRMTKTVFANGMSKIVPVIGAAVSGSITLVSFQIGANRLKRLLSSMEISDPSFYREDQPSEDNK